jgi:methylisocitrate lyase
MSSDDRARRFRTLHQRGAPLVLVNVWDAASARAVEQGGAAAIATGSWSVAAANGFPDGEQMPRDVLMASLRRITSATTLPVTVDLESGYGADGDAVAATIRASIEAGAIGCNLEDSHPATGALRSIEDAAHRIRAARTAADAACPGYFINARCDVFFDPSAPTHSAAHVAEAVRRAQAYAEAGADGLFAPGLQELALVRELASASPLPLNIMRMGRTPSVTALADAGVARISHGPFPLRAMLDALTMLARELAS